MIARHSVIAVVLVALPLAHPLLGSGPAYTMYASSLEFQLDLRGRTRSGTTKSIPPTSLATSLPPSASPFVAGADRFRRTCDVSVLRRHLADLGRLACHLDVSLDEVDVELIERASGASKRTDIHVRCLR